MQVRPPISQSRGQAPAASNGSEAGRLLAERALHVNQFEPRGQELSPDELSAAIATAAFAFRGYDVTNQGRSHELLAHHVYGPIVRETLDEASRISSEVLRSRVDLVDRVRRQAPSTLESYGADAAIIVAMELAQIRLLREVFEIPIDRAMSSFGFSIGEVSALIAGGVYRMDQLLPVLLPMADDTAELVEGTSMGILFTKGDDLPFGDVERLCRRISGQGAGLIGPSAFLSPNAALLIGQGDTVERFRAAMPDQLPSSASLRIRPNRWPPLHTPLVWHKSIPNRSAVALHGVGGGHQGPTPKLISCVTGAESYDEWNSRKLLVEWTDHPQRLWDVIDRSLASGVRLVIHVGPEPTLIPATYKRLSDNVIEYMRSRRVERLGRSVLSGLGRHTWLTRLLPAGASLVRAPLVAHLVLEDWLLEQDVS